MKTIKMKKVLIALDYDPTSQKVAEMGFSLAKTMDAEVILCHIISDPVHYSTNDHITIMGFAGYMDTSQDQLVNNESLKKISLHFLDKTKKHLGDKSIQTVISEGDFAEAILKAAIDLHADVIVLGSHSRKWLESIIMGSVAEKVLHLTTIPLVIIPTKKQK
jgi:nucleotide-binding universal stress UspA family protein